MSEAVFSHYISRFFRLIILMISLFFLIGYSESWAQNARPDRLTVFAAASLKPAFKEIVPLFEKEHDVKLVLSFAGSGALARQIEYGAPADVFVSANDDWMRYLEERGLVQESVTLFSNALVLIESTKYDNARDFAMTRSELLKRLGDGTIALGNVTSVPAGLYAKAAFEFLGLWSDIKSRVAQTDSVRAALRLTELEEARMAVVYASDHVGSARVRVLYEFQRGVHPDIVYTCGRLSEGNRELASLFLNFLTQESVKKLFYAQGFRPLADE